MDRRPPPLGPALRRAWTGYQRRLDEAMAAAGYDDRAFPDGRVLRLCRDNADMTVSQIGRELGITRQGAAKIVQRLRDLGYVAVTPSATSGRENNVQITRRARDYLGTQRRLARSIEQRLRKEVGAERFDTFRDVLDVLGGDEQPRMRDYLRNRGAREL